MATLYADCRYGDDAYTYAQCQSPITPKRTISGAYAVALTGDTITVQAGEYNETVTARASITITMVANGFVVLNGASPIARSSFWYGNTAPSSNVPTLIGFVYKGFSTALVHSVFCDVVTIRNCRGTGRLYHCDSGNSSYLFVSSCAVDGLGRDAVWTNEDYRNQSYLNNTFINQVPSVTAVAINLSVSYSTGGGCSYLKGCIFYGWNKDVVMSRSEMTGGDANFDDNVHCTVNTASWCISSVNYKTMAQLHAAYPNVDLHGVQQDAAPGFVDIANELLQLRTDSAFIGPGFSVTYRGAFPYSRSWSANYDPDGDWNVTDTLDLVGAGSAWYRSSPTITKTAAGGFKGLGTVTSPVKSFAGPATLLKIHKSSVDFYPYSVVDTDNPVSNKPVVCAGVDSGSAGLCTAGAHLIAVSHVVGGLDGPVGVGVSVTVAASRIMNVSSIEVGPDGTTARKLWMTKAGTLSPYYLAATIANNVDTTGTISIADASLVTLPAPYSAQPNNVTMEYRTSNGFFAQGAALPAWVVANLDTTLVAISGWHFQLRATLRNDGRAS